MLRTLWKCVEKTDGTEGTEADSRRSRPGAPEHRTRWRAMSGPDATGLQLCSECRGDYEDPDVSAMRDEAMSDESSPSEGDEEEADCESDQKFPARRERR